MNAMIVSLLANIDMSNYILNIGDASYRIKLSPDGASLVQATLAVGEVWTKDLGNGLTSVVRADDGTGVIGRADQFAHFHKEGVPTSLVQKGNFPYDAPTVFKFDDFGNKSFLENFNGNHIKANGPYHNPAWPSAVYDIVYPSWLSTP